jgi:hypothetical protein
MEAQASLLRPGIPIYNHPRVGRLSLALPTQITALAALSIARSLRKGWVTKKPASRLWAFPTLHLLFPIHGLHPAQNAVG